MKNIFQHCATLWDFCVIFNEKKNILYFRTCKIHRYESPSTYAFAHILRLRTATAGGAACAGATAVQNRSGHVVPDGGRGDEPEFRRLLRSIQTDVPEEASFLKKK